MIDAESGILVPAGDAPALAEAMIQLAQNPERRMRMGEAAQARCQKLFSPKAVVPLILETYSRIAAPSKDAKPIKLNGNPHPWSSTHE